MPGATPRTHHGATASRHGDHHSRRADEACRPANPPHHHGGTASRRAHHHRAAVGAVAPSATPRTRRGWQVRGAIPRFPRGVDGWAVRCGHHRGDGAVARPCAILRIRHGARGRGSHHGHPLGHRGARGWAAHHAHLRRGATVNHHADHRCRRAAVGAVAPSATPRIRRGDCLNCAAARRGHRAVDGWAAHGGRHPRHPDDCRHGNLSANFARGVVGDLHPNCRYPSRLPPACVIPCGIMCDVGIESL